jgi:exodeoxyribonuclease-1
VLAAAGEFRDTVVQALERLVGQQQTAWAAKPQDVDGELYDGFLNEQDGRLLPVIRAAEPAELKTLGDDLHDSRLQALLPLYQARNYPKSLTDEERHAWEEFCQHRLQDGGSRSRLARFGQRLQEISQRPGITDAQRYLLEELQLYAESIVVLPDA